MIRDTAAQDRPLAPSAQRPLRRLTPLVAGVAALGLAGAWGVRAWLAAPRSIAGDRIHVAVVERGPLVRDVVAEGRVTAASSPALYAVAAGIVRLRVSPGDRVKRDQPLAEIVSPELHSRRAQEQATLAGLEAELGSAELDGERGRADAQKRIDQAEIDRQTAARELERYRRAYTLGAMPELEVLRREDALKKADVALAHARIDAKLDARAFAFKVRTSRQTCDRQRALVGELQRQIDALVIRSPVDGQVGQLLSADRASVAANSAILTVVDLSAFEVEVQVPDSFAHDLAVDMPAEIRAGTRTFSGRVRSVAAAVVNGEVAARVAFVGDRPAGLRQNQRLSTRILLEEKANVVKVERGPSIEGSLAYVMHGSVAERRAIVTGIASLSEVEILSGLAPGDRVVISGSELFGGAASVRITSN